MVNAYDPLKLVCTKHGEKFVKFSDGGLYSHGCPICVALIRARVKIERGRYRSVTAYTSERVFDGKCPLKPDRALQLKTRFRRRALGSDRHPI